jgi:hypothetical protein
LALYVGGASTDTFEEQLFMRYFTLAAATVAAIFFGGQAIASPGNDGCVGNCGQSSSNSVSNSNSSAAITSTQTQNTTNNNVNVNSNVAKGGSASASAKGGNAAAIAAGGKGGSASARAGDNANSISVGGTTVEAAASTAPLASINPTAACQVPVSAGVGLVGLNTGFGTSYTNESCVQQEQTRFVCEVSGRPGFVTEQGLCRVMMYNLEYVAKARAQMVGGQIAAIPASEAPKFTPVSASVRDGID